MILHKGTAKITIKRIDGGNIEERVSDPEGVVFFQDPEKGRSCIPYTDKVKGMVVTYKEAVIHFKFSSGRLEQIKNIKGAVANLVYDKADPNRYWVTDCEIESQEDCDLDTRREKLFKDEMLLDCLQKFSDENPYDGGWICRVSKKDRGLRLHQTSQKGARKNVRDAIQEFVDVYFMTVKEE